MNTMTATALAMDPRNDNADLLEKFRIFRENSEDLKAAQFTLLDLARAVGRDVARCRPRG